MSTDLIKQLKDNEKPFGLMSEKMQEKANEIGCTEFDYYGTCVWESYPAGDFYNDQACRLRPDYVEKLEIEECEIRTTELGNRVYTGDGEVEIGIQAAMRRRNFLGFKFEDGTWYGASIMPVHRDYEQISWAHISVDDVVSGKVTILDATHVLFRRKK